jgi:hypothetical protein
MIAEILTLAIPLAGPAVQGGVNFRGFMVISLSSISKNYSVR